MAHHLRIARTPSRLPGWSHWPERLGHWLTVWLDWLERRRQRRQLLQLSDEMLKDIGLSRADAMRAAGGWWRADQRRGQGD